MGKDEEEKEKVRVVRAKERDWVGGAGSEMMDSGGGLGMAAAKENECIVYRG